MSVFVWWDTRDCARTASEGARETGAHAASRAARASAARPTPLSPRPLLTCSPTPSTTDWYIRLRVTDASWPGPDGALLTIFGSRATLDAAASLSRRGTLVVRCHRAEVRVFGANPPSLAASCAAKQGRRSSVALFSTAREDPVVALFTTAASGVVRVDPVLTAVIDDLRALVAIRAALGGFAARVLPLAAAAACLEAGTAFDVGPVRVVAITGGGPGPRAPPRTVWLWDGTDARPLPRGGPPTVGVTRVTAPGGRAWLEAGSQVAPGAAPPATAAAASAVLALPPPSAAPADTGSLVPAVVIAAPDALAPPPLPAVGAVVSLRKLAGAVAEGGSLRLLWLPSTAVVDAGGDPPPRPPPDAGRDALAAWAPDTAAYWAATPAHGWERRCVRATVRGVRAALVRGAPPPRGAAAWTVLARVVGHEPTDLRGAVVSDGGGGAPRFVLALTVADATGELTLDVPPSEALTLLAPLTPAAAASNPAALAARLAVLEGAGDAVGPWSLVCVRAGGARGRGGARRGELVSTVAALQPPPLPPGRGEGDAASPPQASPARRRQLLPATQPPPDADGDDDALPHTQPATQPATQSAAALPATQPATQPPQSPSVVRLVIGRIMAGLRGGE